MNLLITGSVNYNITSGIKEILHKIKTKQGTDGTIIATRDGLTGVDKNAKKIALDFEFEYGLFNIYHSNHSTFSIMSKWKFNKQYSSRHYFWRDNDAVK